MKNIYLIGMRGSGKTTIGKILAEKLGKEFTDMDQEIELMSGNKITTIVEEEGWKTFRLLEKEIVERICQKENQVVGTGGGVLMCFDNADKFKKTGTLIFLRTSPETIIQRLSKVEERPSLTGENFLEEIENVWKERKDTYEKHADLDIDTEEKTPNIIAEEIIKKI